MRKIRDVLRYRHTTDLSLEAISRALDLSKGVVAKYVKLANAAELGWPLPEAFADDQALERALYPNCANTNVPANYGSPPDRSVLRPNAKFVEPDYAAVHQELKRKGVTLTLLWQEYCQTVGHATDAAPSAATDAATDAATPAPYRYTAFCTRYRDWAHTLKRSMRQIHRAGEKLFIDYAGPTVPITDTTTGEVRQASIFVAVLGASNYTFACATPGQTQQDWLSALARALSFIGGVPQLIVPDNARALVSKADRYEPELNRTTQQFANHYQTVILPARPRKPQDKAKVEVGVQIVERWILARLRHRRFFSVAELDCVIAELLPELNTRAFKKLPGNRMELFQALDAPALRALPSTAFEFAQWKRARVNIDYHVQFEHHYYSVPCKLVRQEVELRITRTALEVFARGQRVASHALLPTAHYSGTSVGSSSSLGSRSAASSGLKAGYSTVAEHMPAAHRAHAQWTPGKLITWAASIGAATAALVTRLLHDKAHPEQGYRACLGLMRLAREVGHVRMEAACTRAMAIGAPRYGSVKSILDRKLDQLCFAGSAVTESAADVPRVIEQMELTLPEHSNVRGAQYYH
jgi:transposase